MYYDVIIIGGGASGLACAVKLLKSGKNLKVLIVEAGERLGKKLAATGNGQGNISNEDMRAEHFHGGNIKLAERIACSDPYAGAKMFACLFSADSNGRIYPTGKQASALTDYFITVLKNNVNFKIFNGAASSVLKCKNGYKVAMGVPQTEAECKYLALCTGGKAQKQFKTDGSAYKLAVNLGHTLTELYPSLVQLKTQTEHIKTLKGIRTDCNVCVQIGGKIIYKTRGDVIFTDYGVSGNAIFSASAYVAGNDGATLLLEFLPEFSSEEIEGIIQIKKDEGWAASELLSGTLHNQIGRAVIKRAQSDNPQKIVQTLKNFTLPVTETLGFDYAQVTKGGVNMDEISDELESKICKNLFFAGEILDIDGDCGGYNLQWAFTSGCAVADAILKRL